MVIHVNCKKCNKPLNESIREGNLKSCPRCSQNNPAQVHIFYPDSHFGTTVHRITRNNQDGIQSHCTSCRSGQNQITGTSCIL